ncbi:MAG: rhamnogalacturonan lyase [Bacteroidaceae bacterium]|nr:rhamnogalacturonan lyase [Bacteroidaceae bacterium]
MSNVQAQRKTDQLDRGLVAVKVSSGVYVSWRVQADEYYGVTYKLYRNGALIAQNLYASNYTDAGGSASSTYTVAAVKNGVEKQACAAVATWQNQSLEIPVSNVQARSGVTVWKQNDPSSAMANYTINDISLGDVDGDGKIDFIVKRKNQTDQDNLFPVNNYQMYCQIEVYASTINYGRLWWIDCGPNICYGADEQWDAVAFDWNEDGACEVLYRGGANTVIHHADGTTETIGNVNENIRGGISHVANMTFSNSGEEWLMYINGRNGYTYDVISYPLPRGNASDWGDTYGHRSSKYFMGAPYLDGVNPYIFLGRGIYTKTDACTYRVNKSTNKLYKVGNTWHSYTNSGWYGQGNHNFSIADVDEDGSDEIIYGSMVLDFHTGDNSIHGCSSTGLGHGDASHTGDLDPFRRGLETFACNEDNPCNNYRNAATCEIYARTMGTADDGRAMAGNFTNEYPGCIGASSASGIIPLSYVQPNPTSPVYISGMSNNWNAQTPYPMALNFRIYWDGDLLSETINGPGSKEGYLYVDKLGKRIFDTGHGTYATANINGTKKNPCAVGDILGDWREEIVMRSSDNRFIRVYTTVVPTEHRMQSLWYDHQYRQAMVWQTEGYNQPAHPSFFVGELEGFTQAPPALTLADRTVVGNSGSVTTSLNGKDVFVSPDGNGSQYSVSIDAGAKPATLFLNSRTTIEGGDRVQYLETKHTWDRIRLTGNGLSGATNLCKQGSSAAHLPYATHTHSGKTDVWQGALICNGSITNSALWANRFTELFLGSDLTAAESSYKSVDMEYGSALYITSNLKSTPYVNDNGYAHMSVGNLTIKEGSRLVFDVRGSGNASGDRLNIGTLFVRTQDWQYGPEYLMPVVDVRSDGALADGDYLLGTLQALAEGSASLLDVKVECTAQVSGHFGTVFFNEANHSYYLHVGSAIDASYQVDAATYLDVLTQNFEGTDWLDNWTIAQPSRLTAVQQSNGASGSKCIWLKSVLDANNGTSATYTIPAISAYAATGSYTFDFDFAQTSIIGSNANRAGEIILRDENANAIVTFRAFTGASTGEVVVDGSVVGHYAVTKGTYFKTETAPVINHHVTLQSSSAGTVLTIDGTSIDVSASFVKVGSILYNTNRYAGQVQFDNINLNCRVETPRATRSALGNTTDIESEATQAYPVAYYSLEGRQVVQPQAGHVYIVRMSDGTVRKVKF